jgi:pimeloyl-ACP methyl ester carboxylesterase
MKVVAQMLQTYTQAMRRAGERVAGLSSHRFSSDFGDMQYVDEGTGPAVLLAHGIYGGHVNATDMVEVVLGSGYRTIGPSRFGYFGSSLPADATVEGQADAYVKLLDHLGIDKVIAVGYSAGGPSAVALALNHPARLYGLILAAAYLPKPGAVPELVAAERHRSSSARTHHGGPQGLPPDHGRTNCGRRHHGAPVPDQ